MDRSYLFVQFGSGRGRDERCLEKIDSCPVATAHASAEYLHLILCRYLGPKEVRDVSTAGLSKPSPEGLEVFVNVRQTVSVLEKYFDLIALGTLNQFKCTLLSFT